MVRQPFQRSSPATFTGAVVLRRGGRGCPWMQKLIFIGFQRTNVEAFAGLTEEPLASVSTLLRIFVSSGAGLCLRRKSGRGSEARLCELDFDLFRAHGNGAARVRFSKKGRRFPGLFDAHDGAFLLLNLIEASVNRFPLGVS